MESKNLIICDKEKEYASAFAHYIMTKDELAFQVQTCSSPTHVLSVQEKEKIDYLFVSSCYPPEERKKMKAGKVFVLTEDGTDTLEEDETAVYKYRPGNELLAELVRHCSTESGTGSIFLKTVGKKQVKIIGVYSPIHRIGKTTYALKLGKKLAEDANVLYLSLETYGGVGGHFAEGGQTLSDVLYYARQEKSNLGLILTTIVGHKEKLDYVPPIQVSEDIKTVSGEEWIGLIQKIMEQSIYEILILDMDEGIREIYPVLRICNEIHMLVTDDFVSESKVRQFEDELMLLGHEDIRRKIIRKEQSI